MINPPLNKAPRAMCVVGARPNLIKMAPILRAFDADGRVEPMLVHTGQHYDAAMSSVFFRDLEIDHKPINLGVGSGTHAQQTGAVMCALEGLVVEQRPDVMVTVGDVNSTVAAAIVAAKAGIPQAHIEAGLRSGDPAMPEEVNRVVADRLADLLFTHSEEADANLAREGVPTERVHRVGNVMIDTLVRLRSRWQGAGRRAVPDLPARYGVVTLHRPANVDVPAQLERLLMALGGVATELPLVFPVHPRTAARLRCGVPAGVRLCEPLGYLAFLDLVEHSRVVLTDSGGIQEETTMLGVPCLTLRDTTERPVTIRLGTNRLVGNDPAAIGPAVRAVLASRPAQAASVPLWDGATAGRIVRVIAEFVASPAPLRLAG